MASSYTDTIYQASDLNQQYRALLDAARQGDVRIRDKDGFSIMLVPERRLRVLETISEVSANLLTLEMALARQPSQLTLIDYGAWTWLRHLDPDDLQVFLREAREVLLIAAREQDSAELDSTLYAWQRTAEAATDPKRKDILLGRWTDDDFLEVGRPTTPGTGDE